LIVVDKQSIGNTTISNEITSFPRSSGTVRQNRAADFDVNEIESIEILEKATASAI
jgi:hypothetical protein